MFALRRARASGHAARRRRCASCSRGLAQIGRDAAFWRVALCVGANQCAVLALFTLWITTWLRDVAGYDRAARGAAALGWVALAPERGLPLLRPARRRARGRGARCCRSSPAAWRRRSPASALLTLGVTTGAVVLWMACIFFGTGSTLSHSIATRRFPIEMAGRVNTALNTFTFMGVFIGQWASGAILGLWPPTATGYEPAAYFYAFGALWLVQASRARLAVVGPAPLRDAVDQRR